MYRLQGSTRCLSLFRLMRRCFPCFIKTSLPIILRNLKSRRGMLPCYVDSPSQNLMLYPIRAEMLVLSVKIYHGDARTIMKENTSLLQDTPLTLRLGFPDVVFPGDVRNELYIKLWSGDFSGTHNGSGRLSVANLRG